MLPLQVPRNWSNSRLDYKEFQTLITGKINLLNVGILTISGKDVISDSQVLQFWDNNGTRTIRFFRNAGDQKFSEYETARLKHALQRKNLSYSRFRAAPKMTTSES